MTKYLPRTTAFVLAFLVTTVLSSSFVRAQNYNNNYDLNGRRNIYGNNNNQNNGYNELGEYIGDQEETEMEVDTTAPRIRKPLESYFFDDSTRVRPNFAWNVDTYRNRIKFADIDTMLYDSQIIYPFLRKGVGDAYQGNLGGASIPLDYFQRPTDRDHELFNAFDAYYFTPENVRFFNVKNPFTQFSYYWGGQKKYLEETFGITHAQNISPSSGFNIDYHSRGSRGIYNSQKGRAKSLSVAFSHTGKKYSVHAGYIYNAIINKENGGIVEDWMITGSTADQSILELAENIPTHLDDARNTIKNNTYYMVHSYGVPLRRLTVDDFSIADRSSVYFGLATIYSRWSRVYTDTRGGSRYSYQGSDNVYDYYENWFSDPQNTRDSIFNTTLSNRAFIQLQPWDRDGVIGVIDGGVGMDMHQYYTFTPEEYLKGKSNSKKLTSYYFYGSVSGKIKRYFDWAGDVQYHPTGFRSGDASIGANASGNIFIKDKPLTLSARFSHDRRSPGYRTEYYYSNHFQWSRSFGRELETRLEAKLEMPTAGFELGASQSVITDKIYFDQNCKPVQSSGEVTVTGVYAKKDFRLGGLHLNHRVLLQWTSDDHVVPVPLASAFLAYYYEFNVVKNVLRMQIGIDCRYNTSYYAFSYQPATSVFYNQREMKVGEYPMMDAFVSAKWKRMRILLAIQHLNQDLIGDNNYFSLPHYPLKQRVFKMGISWTFYD